MLVKFFLHLRAHDLPVSIRELLDLLNILDQGLCQYSLDDFYELSRMAMIKDEKYYDKFDVAFGSYFSGDDTMVNLLDTDIPDEWLKKMIEKHLSEEEKKNIQSLGGFDALMKTLQERLQEQKERHQGGNKWVGTGGTSPFGAFGYNPEGIRMGQNMSRHRSAVKVWDKRAFKNLDEDKVLEKRNLAIALRHLRSFSREGEQEELDLAGTIQKTAQNAGLLEVSMVPEKRNNVKVLMLFDIGGSMGDHVALTQELFSQAKTSFKHLEYFYFHNCVYEDVWIDNHRRHTELINTMSLMNRFGADYKLIIVGDASMSPYEIVFPGGSVEHMNKEAGEVWLQRLFNHFKSVVWLNPHEKKYWGYTHSIQMVRELTEDRMFPLTISGITEAMKKLS
jgi:uncharacterized protein